MKNEYLKKIADLSESLDIGLIELENRNEELEAFQRCNSIISGNWDYKLVTLQNGYSLIHRDGGEVGFKTVFNLESFLKESFWE